MIIGFSPQRRDDALSLSRIGQTLVVNGDPIDFSPIPNGATLPAGAIASEWIAGDVHRIDGRLHVTLVLPNGPNPSQAVAFPAAIIDPADGTISIPCDTGFTQQEEAANGDD